MRDDRDGFIEDNCSRCAHQKKDCFVLPRAYYLGKVWYPMECPDFVRRPLTEEELKELEKMLDELFRSPKHLCQSM